MKKSRIYTIMKEDLIFFPPALSLLRALNELGYEVIHIGYYSDEKQRSELQNKGVRFVETPTYHTEGNFIQKYYDIFKFKKQVIKFLEKKNITSDDYVWIINPANMIPLNTIIGKYRTVLQFYEFAKPNVTLSYWIYNPFFNLKKACKKAEKIVHCEPTRALFFKEFYQLDEIPFVIPNKPVFDDEVLISPPVDILGKVEKIKKIIEGKKVILYQGIFSAKERRLEEFCEAIHRLPKEYVFLAMGRGGDYFNQLSEQYKDDNRIFLVDFIKPPYHLLITQLAHIGVLTYFPPSPDVADIINIFYCAPNKIFEFGKYGIPMISNNLPGLAQTFKEYNCGRCIQNINDPGSICEAVNVIDENYSLYSSGAFKYFDSVDIISIIKNLINNN